MPPQTVTMILTSINTTADLLTAHLRDLTAMITGARTATTTGTTSTTAPTATAATPPTRSRTRETTGWRRMNAIQRRAYVAKKKATATATTRPKLKLVRKRAA